MKYTWSGRSENKTKHCFEELTQIQSILWCAMLKVSPNYSIRDLQEDLKSNLSKCAALGKNTNNKQNQNTDSINVSVTGENK